MVAQQTRDYELMIVLSPEATEEELSATMERVHRFITERDGSIGKHEVWGLRRLAFPIMNFMEGNYVLTQFTLPPSDVVEFNRSLEAAEDVLRSLVTKV